MFGKAFFRKSFFYTDVEPWNYGSKVFIAMCPEVALIIYIIGINSLYARECIGALSSIL